MPKICMQKYTFLYIFIFMILAKYSVYKRPLKVFYRLCTLQEMKLFKIQNYARRNENNM